MRPRGTVGKVKFSRYAVSLVLARGVLVAVTVAVPCFPHGSDIYVHAPQPWLVMRGLQVGSNPVWLPDLNAGFDAPGVGLYSRLARPSAVRWVRPWGSETLGLARHSLSPL